MRRKITLGITLVAIVALSALATFAYTDPFAASPRPQFGPQFHKKMVARHDTGATGARPSPGNPTKPIPIDQAVAGPGHTLAGYNRTTGATPVATVTPQARLESSLKSLASELR